MQRGKLITLEGGDRTGKSQLLGSLKDIYGDHEGSYRMQYDKEPWDSDYGAMAIASPDPLSQLFLFCADRALHTQQMQAFLSAGYNRICDRFTDSTIAYQGYGHGIDLETIRQLNQIASRGLVPDLTILLDLDPVIAQSRGVASDAIEEMDLSFHQRVRTGYLVLAVAEPGRFTVIDAGLPADEVLRQAREAIDRVIGQ